MQPAVRVEHLAKRYRIDHSAEARGDYKTLRESLVGAVKAPFKRFMHKGNGNGTPRVEEFWALRDVSFEVQPGEAVAIVGRNGAGKSTLLKLLSRITKPTRGHISLNGRVGSLLEVGTGFHPELSGRENVYLNGSILGMTRREIDGRFDAIVDFSGVEKFLDTPVKRYSSGMYVRLAFAVAAYLNPEILIVDEVLAVGDAEFQRKCLGKMKDVAEGGRTVLLVSHNMASVRRLSHRAVILNKGEVQFTGPIDDALAFYLNQGNPNEDSGCVSLKDRPGQRDVCFEWITVTNSEGELSKTIKFGEPFTVTIGVTCSIETAKVVVGVRVDDFDGFPIFTTRNTDTRPSGSVQPLTHGNHSATWKCDPNVLCPGRYGISIAVADSGFHAYDYIDRAIGFEVSEVPIDADRVYRQRRGSVMISYPWEFADVQPDSGISPQ
jgi:lipopolysaccharide transport system ATP-binding protein